MGLLPDTQNCGLPMRWECRERFSPPPRVSYPEMHNGTCVTHVPWCMPGSLTSGFLWSRWRGNRSRHSRRMRNPQFYVSVKRPIAGISKMKLAIQLLEVIEMANRSNLKVSSCDVYICQGIHLVLFRFEIPSLCQSSFKTKQQICNDQSTFSGDW